VVVVTAFELASGLLRGQLKARIKPQHRHAASVPSAKRTISTRDRLDHPVQSTVLQGAGAQSCAVEGLMQGACITHLDAWRRSPPQLPM